ncbi:copper chaperone PCu(A)C [Brevundimonas sp.]|uniref:copper chaperone PCu(A)C n=2 Tax=unclassified Brevundimonas TaxID=2622653 RepID=UPI002897183C|nr:copper chaperone PCu(A)C [Brevundimonas sp.]
MKYALALAAVAALTLAACSQQGEAPQSAPDAPAAPAAPQPAPVTPTTVAGTITVEDAWCRPTPNGAKAGGCYVILTASETDTFKGVSFEGADMTQIHEMKTEGGVMSMAHLENGLPMPAGQRVELKPHGNHIMLMGLKAPLVAGQTAKITLDFDKAEDVTVDFQIRTPPVVGGEE